MRTYTHASGTYIIRGETEKKININGIEAKLMWEPKCLSLSSVDEVIVYRFPHFI